MAAYVVIGWLALQVTETMAAVLDLPDSASRVVFLALLVGFIPTILFSWAYELTPDGIKKESEVDHSDSITHATAKKLDVITLVAVFGLVCFFLVDRFFVKEEAVIVQSAQVSAKLGEHSIAVLPFANRSNKDDDLFFTDGIHDDLLTQLAKIKDMKVISRTSVMEYRDTTKKIPEIARELGVAKVLEGGVQRAGHRIRINAQLIDVATDEHLWAETFDEEMTIDNVFDIQSKIARQIVLAVKGHMSAGDERVQARVPTSSIEAYDLYLKAKQHITSSGQTDEKYQSAQPLLERAVALDPDFALAHLLLSEIHAYAVWLTYDDGPHRRVAAREAIDRAASVLGADAPEVLAAEGNFLYRFERDFAGAMAAQATAYEAMPGSAWLAGSLGASQRRLGLWEEAVENMVRASELDPTSVEPATLAAATILLHRDFERLARFLEHARKRFPRDASLAGTDVMLSLMSEGDTISARKKYESVRPEATFDYIVASLWLPWFERDARAALAVVDVPEIKAGFSDEQGRAFRDVYKAGAWLHLGEEAPARVLLKKVADREIIISVNPFSVTFQHSNRATALVLLGETERAIVDAEQAVSLINPDNDKLEGFRFVAAKVFVLARAGRRDEALALLPEVLDKPSGLERWGLYLDPRWDFMRDDERFNEMIRPHNLEQSIHANGRLND